MIVAVTEGSDIQALTNRAAAQSSNPDWGHEL